MLGGQNWYKLCMKKKQSREGIEGLLGEKTKIQTSIHNSAKLFLVIIVSNPENPEYVNDALCQEYCFINITCSLIYSVVGLFYIYNL